MLRFLHTADLHLGASVSGLPESVAASVREGLFDTLARICDAARDEKVDALLIAGDLFDTPTPSRSIAERAFELLGRCGTRVFISPGNHDPLLPRSPYLMLSLPENVHVFRSERIEAVDCGEFVVYGAGFMSESVTRPLLEGFRADTDRASVMVLHGDLAPNSRYDPVLAEDVAASGLSYLALGHVHMRSDLLRSGNTAYSYPGCPAGHGFDELGEKGAYLVEMDDGVSTRFLPLGARKFVAVESNEPTLPAGYEQDIVKLVVTGEREPIDVGAVERELASKAFCIRVVDRTQLPRRIWQRADEDTLAGAFLAALIAEREGGADPEMVELAARYGLDALDGEVSSK